MRDYEMLRDIIKSWTRLFLEGDYINQSISLDYLNNELVDLHKENAQLKSELRKWNRLNIENLAGAKQQWLDNENSLTCAKIYINGLFHTLKHCQEALRKCSPYKADFDADAFICQFCGMEEDYNMKGEASHDYENCEYIRLTTESEG